AYQEPQVAGAFDHPPRHSAVVELVDLAGLELEFRQAAPSIGAFGHVRSIRQRDSGDGVFVYVKVTIESDEFATGTSRERVDLEQAGVVFEKDCGHLFEHVPERFEALADKSNARQPFRSMVMTELAKRVQRETVNRAGPARRRLF